MMSQTLRLSDGASVGYLEAGQGRPVLLIHGVGLNAHAWAPQIEALAKTGRVIAVDMPGHGRSDPLPEAATLADYVRWAGKVVEALGAGPVALAGHSMGALVAEGLAVERPDLVERLALLSAVHRRTSEGREAVLARADEIARGMKSIDGPIARWFGDEAGAVRDQVAGWLAAVDPRGYATAYRAFANGDAAYADRLAEIRCPTLALTADGDSNSSPEMSRQIAAAVRSGTAVVIEGHRHMFGLTAPAQVNDKLMEWLEMVPNPTPNPRALRDAFGCFMTGVTVVTTTGTDSKPVGFTANSFSSVSLDPPLLLVSIANTSRSYAAFVNGRGFAVNILSEEQKAISATFAKPVADRFAGLAWEQGPAGSPVFSGTSAWFDCDLHQVIAAGDHTILIGEVVGYEASQAPGLGYYRGAYVTPATTAAKLPTGPNVLISVIMEAPGKILLVDDGTGALTLPSMPATQAGVQASLDKLIAQTGLQAKPGSIYSVYDDTERGAQHIAFRCPTADGTPAHGMFVELKAENLARVADHATRTMLQRLAEEARMGNYGVYFGNQQQGRVTAASERFSA